MTTQSPIKPTIQPTPPRQGERDQRMGQHTQHEHGKAPAQQGKWSTQSGHEHQKGKGAH